MKIKTKYSIGDVVILLRDNNILPAEIIEITYRETWGRVELKYRIEILSDNYRSTKEEWVVDNDIWGKYSNKNAKCLVLKCLSKVTSEPEKKLEHDK